MTGELLNGRKVEICVYPEGVEPEDFNFEAYYLDDREECSPNDYRYLEETYYGEMLQEAAEIRQAAAEARYDLEKERE